jgi:hypothetical protein
MSSIPFDAFVMVTFFDAKLAHLQSVNRFCSSCYIKLSCASSVAKNLTETLLKLKIQGGTDDERILSNREPALSCKKHNFYHLKSNNVSESAFVRRDSKKGGSLGFPLPCFDVCG